MISFGTVIVIIFLAILILVILIQTLDLIRDLLIIIIKLCKGKKGMQKQRILFVQKIMEAVAEKHELTRTMLSLTSVKGIKNNKDKCVFVISPLRGKKNELEALKSPKVNFSVTGKFKWKNIFHMTCNEKVCILFVDGLLWGYYRGLDDDDDVDKFALKMHKKTKLECDGDFNEENKQADELPLSESRKAFLADFTIRLEKADGKLPLLTLSEFFDGNLQEDSIAPNQWDDDEDCDRPTLAEMWKRFREIEERPDVAWVRVQLHDSTSADEYACNIHADVVVICTTANADDMAEAVDTDTLGSDGVATVYSFSDFTDVPDIPEGYQALAIVWD